MATTLRLTVRSQTLGPGTLNAWLRDNSGYDDSNDLYEAAVQEIDPEHIVSPSDGMR